MGVRVGDAEHRGRHRKPPSQVLPHGNGRINRLGAARMVNVAVPGLTPLMVMLMMAFLPAGAQWAHSGYRC